MYIYIYINSWVRGCSHLKQPILVTYIYRCIYMYIKSRVRGWSHRKEIVPVTSICTSRFIVNEQIGTLSLRWDQPRTRELIYIYASAHICDRFDSCTTIWRGTFMMNSSASNWRLNSDCTIRIWVHTGWRTLYWLKWRLNSSILFDSLHPLLTETFESIQGGDDA